MNKKAFFALILSLTVTTAGHAFELAGLDGPESVVVDRDSGNTYISNVNGDALARDNNGYISKVSQEGKIVVLKFIEGVEDEFELHAPKGMAIVKDVLYVTDLDAVKGFDLETGEFRGSVDLEEFEPKFLNDLAAGKKGILYASDMYGNRIFRLDLPAKKAEIFKEGEELGQPNGLYVHPRSGRLIVVSWNGGGIIDITPEGEIRRLRTDLAGGLDGIAADHTYNRIYVSNHQTGDIYEIQDWGKGVMKVFRSGLETPADIFFDKSKKRLLVPLMGQGVLLSYDTDR